MPGNEDIFPPVVRIDTRGQSSAWAILSVERAVERLRPGQVLEVRLGDPDLARDLPRVLNRRAVLSVVSRRDKEGLSLRVGPAEVRARKINRPRSDQDDQLPEQRRQSVSQLLTEIPETASTVDARGSACPGPLLEAKKAIGGVMVGQVLEVLSNDPGTKDDIPVWAAKVGHAYLGYAASDGCERIFVRRQK